MSKQSITLTSADLGRLVEGQRLVRGELEIQLDARQPQEVFAAVAEGLLRRVARRARTAPADPEALLTLARDTLTVLDAAQTFYKSRQRSDLAKSKELEKSLRAACERIVRRAEQGGGS